MNRELNHFTQLFLIAGFYQYLQPKFFDLQRFEFVADWFCDSFSQYPHYAIYDMSISFEDAYLKSFK